MTLAELRNGLATFEENQTIGFQVDGEIIEKGFHITELWHSSAHGIDCSAKLNRWEETRLQILVGYGTDVMTLNKLRAILGQSVQQISKLQDTPLHIEIWQHGKGLKVTTVSEMTQSDDRLIIALQDAVALCKPARLDPIGQGTACC